MADIVLTYRSGTDITITMAIIPIIMGCIHVRYRSQEHREYSARRSSHRPRACLSCVRMAYAYSSESYGVRNAQW